jgi:hypothetical protein
MRERARPHADHPLLAYERIKSLLFVTAHIDPAKVAAGAEKQVHRGMSGLVVGEASGFVWGPRRLSLRAVN